MSVKHAIIKNCWMVLLGLTALVIGVVMGVGGLIAGGIGCLLVFSYEIFKVLLKRSDTDD